MKRQIMKTIRRISHLHLHLGIYFAIAAVIITALHTSADMIYAIYGVQSSFGDAGEHTMREGREYETHTSHAQINVARRSYIGGA